MKLIALFTQVLTFLSGLKAHAAELQAALDTANGVVTDIKGKLDANQLEHADLIARAEAAEAKATELATDSAAIDAKAAEVAAAINDHPETPTVDATTLAVTDAPAAPVAPVAPAPAAE